MAKKVILYVILIVLGISLTSCQTIQGVGSDIQWSAKKSADALGVKEAKAEGEEPQTGEGKKAKAEEQESEGWGGKRTNVGEDRY